MIAAQQAVPPDSVRAVLRSVFAAPEYEWTRHRNIRELLRDGWSWFLAFLERMQLEHPVAYLVVLCALVLCCVLLFAHMGSIVRRALRPPRRVAPGAAPLPPPRDAGWHLAQARQLVDAGRFDEALGHRFRALVFELGRRRAVDVRPSKTPAEYAREARLDAPGRRAFDDLVGQLYLALFGGAPCDAEGWLRFDRAAGALGRHVQAR